KRITGDNRFLNEAGTHADMGEVVKIRRYFEDKIPVSFSSITNDLVVCPWRQRGGSQPPLVRTGKWGPYMRMAEEEIE
ncbi:MAG: hypothetical protein AB1700_07165, partial [Bacillota bacterium]